MTSLLSFYFLPSIISLYISQADFLTALVSVSDQNAVPWRPKSAVTSPTPLQGWKCQTSLSKHGQLPAYKALMWGWVLIPAFMLNVVSFTGNTGNKICCFQKIKEAGKCGANKSLLRGRFCCCWVLYSHKNSNQLNFDVCVPASHRLHRAFPRCVWARGSGLSCSWDGAIRHMLLRLLLLPLSVSPYTRG